MGAQLRDGLSTCYFESMRFHKSVTVTRMVRGRMATSAAASMVSGISVYALCEEQCATTSTKAEYSNVIGKWRQDADASDSLGPFLTGLGVPSIFTRFVDLIRTDLTVVVQDDGK